MELLDNFGDASGCCINWLKTKLVALNGTTVPQFLAHVERIMGEAAHPYLGLPL